MNAIKITSEVLYKIFLVVIITSGFSFIDNKITQLLDNKNETSKVITMRITGYIPTGNKTAIGQKMVVGRTAAVSPACNYLLGEEVYIQGYGVRYVNDITADWLDEKYDICTLDLAVPNKQEAHKINSIKKVIRIN